MVGQDDRRKAAGSPSGAQQASGYADLMEKASASLPLENGVVTVHTGPFEIKTVRLRFASQPGSTRGTSACRRPSHPEELMLFLISNSGSEAVGHKP